MSSASTNPTFPTLHILPVDKLLLHERHDAPRALSLKERLNADAALRNPPIVAPLLDAQGHYVVLDGANRTTAFQTMGIPHILVQVVSPGEPGLNLKTWNHVILGIAPEALLARIRDIPELEVKSDMGTGLLSDTVDGRAVIQLRLPAGEIYIASAPTSNLLRRVELLNLIMDRYGDGARMDRTHLPTVESITDLYPGLAGLIVFPRFKVEDIIHLASARQMIPAGITRFTISPRALRVNYPLSELSADKSLADKNETLHTWIQARVTRKGVRTYEETTVLFDE